METSGKVILKLTSDTDTVKLIEIEGVIDTATAGEFSESINNIIEGIDKQGVFLIFDLAKLTYINSTGLTKLMNCYVNMKQRSGSVKVINVTQDILDVLNLVGATKFIEVCRDINQAMGIQ